MSTNTKIQEILRQMGEEIEQRGWDGDMFFKKALADNTATIIEKDGTTVIIGSSTSLSTVKDKTDGSVITQTDLTQSLVNMISERLDKIEKVLNSGVIQSAIYLKTNEKTMTTLLSMAPALFDVVNEKLVQSKIDEDFTMVQTIWTKAAKMLPVGMNVFEVLKGVDYDPKISLVLDAELSFHLMTDMNKKKVRDLALETSLIVMTSELNRADATKADAYTIKYKKKATGSVLKNSFKLEISINDLVFVTIQIAESDSFEPVIDNNNKIVYLSLIEDLASSVSKAEVRFYSRQQVIDKVEVKTPILVKDVYKTTADLTWSFSGTSTSPNAIFKILTSSIRFFGVACIDDILVAANIYSTISSVVPDPRFKSDAIRDRFETSKTKQSSGKIDAIKIGYDMSKVNDRSELIINYRLDAINDVEIELLELLYEISSSELLNRLENTIEGSMTDSTTWSMLASKAMTLKLAEEGYLSTRSRKRNLLPVVEPVKQMLFQTTRFELKRATRSVNLLEYGQGSKTTKTTHSWKTFLYNAETNTGDYVLGSKRYHAHFKRIIQNRPHYQYWCGFPIPMNFMTGITKATLTQTNWTSSSYTIDVDWSAFNAFPDTIPADVIKIGSLIDYGTRSFQIMDEDGTILDLELNYSIDVLYDETRGSEMQIAMLRNVADEKLGKIFNLRIGSDENSLFNRIDTKICGISDEILRVYNADGSVNVSSGWYRFTNDHLIPVKLKLKLKLDAETGDRVMNVTGQVEFSTKEMLAGSIEQKVIAFFAPYIRSQSDGTVVNGIRAENEIILGDYYLTIKRNDDAVKKWGINYDGLNEPNTLGVDSAVNTEVMFIPAITADMHPPETLGKHGIDFSLNHISSWMMQNQLELTPATAGVSWLTGTTDPGIYGNTQYAFGNTTASNIPNIHVRVKNPDERLTFHLKKQKGEYNNATVAEIDTEANCQIRMNVGFKVSGMSMYVEDLSSISQNEIEEAATARVKQLSSQLNVDTAILASFKQSTVDNQITTELYLDKLEEEVKELQAREAKGEGDMFESLLKGLVGLFSLVDVIGPLLIAGLAIYDTVKVIKEIVNTHADFKTALGLIMGVVSDISEILAKRALMKRMGAKTPREKMSDLLEKAKKIDKSAINAYQTMKTVRSFKDSMGPRFNRFVPKIMKRSKGSTSKMVGKHTAMTDTKGRLWTERKMFYDRVGMSGTRRTLPKITSARTTANKLAEYDVGDSVTLRAGSSIPNSMELSVFDRINLRGSSYNIHDGDSVTYLRQTGIVNDLEQTFQKHKLNSVNIAKRNVSAEMSYHSNINNGLVSSDSLFNEHAGWEEVGFEEARSISANNLEESINAGTEVRLATSTFRNAYAARIDGTLVLDYTLQDEISMLDGEIGKDHDSMYLFRVPGTDVRLEMGYAPELPYELPIESRYSMLQNTFSKTETEFQDLLLKADVRARVDTTKWTYDVENDYITLKDITEYAEIKDVMRESLVEYAQVNKQLKILYDGKLYTYADLQKKFQTMSVASGIKLEDSTSSIV